MQVRERAAKRDEAARQEERGPGESLAKHHQAVAPLALVAGAKLALPAPAASARRPKVRTAHLLKGVPAIVCQLDLHGTVLFANEALKTVTGYDPSELVGQNWMMLCPVDGQQKAESILRRLRSSEVVERELPLKTKDGELKKIAWTLSARTGGAARTLTAFGLDVTGQRENEAQLRHTVAKLEGALEGTIEAIAMTAEVRDPYTAGHQRRVAKLAGGIALALGLTDERIHATRLAGTIHDLGKISVPVEILSKHGAMTQQEVDLLKAHPQVGYAILKMVDFPWPIADIVHQHHERFDGSGYPLGLAGDAILLEARIVAVADVVESMAGPRPYRPALGIDRAIEEISQMRGVLFDPGVVDACLKALHQVDFDWE